MAHSAWNAVRQSAARVARPRALRAGAVACALLILLPTCQVDKLTDSGTQVAVLAVAPTQLLDSAAAGSVGMRADSLILANTGKGTLSWTATLRRDAPWLDLVPASGIAPPNPSKMGLALNPAGLATGVYHDTVVVYAENATGSPALVPVQFVVHPCLVQAIAPDVQVNDSLTTRDCAAPNRAGSFARLYSFTAQALDSISVVMTSTALDGYVVLYGASGGTAPPLAQNDNCGVQSSACLRYQLIGTAGTYLIEATSAGAGATGDFTLAVTRPRAPDRPGAMAQLRTDAVTAVPLGGATPEQMVVLRGVLSDADGSDTLRLQVEVQPLAMPFSNMPQATSDPVPNGVSALVTVSGLVNNTAYHWQARTLDQTGRAGSWQPFGGNLEIDADFGTDIPKPPGLPSNLGQFQSDGSTAIAVGGTTPGRSVIFKATVTDSNPGDALRLDVEVQPVGTAFSGVASSSSSPVPIGGVATTAVAGLSDNTPYHWRARAVDQTGRAGLWVPFGGNEESATDFLVEVAVTRLAFTVQPSDAVAGVAIAPAVRVTAQDALGSTVTSFTGDVTISIGTNPAGGALSGTLTVAAVDGVATFANLSIDRAAAGYTLRAAGGELTVQSAAFTIAPAPAAGLAFTVQPSNAVAGAAIAPAVRVTARDAFGNTATGFTGTVTVALGANTAGGTLSGTRTVAAANGVATFSDLSINLVGTGYTLVASATGLSGPPSAAFDVTEAPGARLVFSQQPSNDTSGTAITPAVRVTALDAFGNTATGFTGNV
ncbi:MAG TPA: hypothetical protein VFU41_06970, partial [Gemmatimonadales bacterium]|nr:hypothetical protein [Gemmatimonadales bacterium]